MSSSKDKSKKKDRAKTSSSSSSSSSSSDNFDVSGVAKKISKDLKKLEKQYGSYRDWETDRKSTRLNSSHSGESRMPSSA